MAWAVGARVSPAPLPAPRPRPGAADARQGRAPGRCTLVWYGQLLLPPPCPLLREA